ncbi:MAG: protein TolR [Alphaproteobacteria bacterium]|nr:protein TolR [Alphaproteobacteria bacterium]
MAGANVDPAGLEEGGYRPLAEINVTPLVDVMLVLLIIFMITAPLLLSNVPLELPRLAGPSVQRPEEPLVVSLNRDGGIFLKDQQVTLDELAGRLRALAPGRRGEVIFVRGDKGVDYGAVMELLGAVGKAGFARISLVADTPPAR